MSAVAAPLARARIAWQRRRRALGRGRVARSTGATAPGMIGLVVLRPVRR